MFSILKKLFILPMCCVLVSCGQSNSSEEIKTVTNVEIQNAIESYNYGDELAIGNMTLKLSYSDGSEEIIPSNQLKIVKDDDFTMYSIGEKTVTIKCDEKNISTSYTFNVVPATSLNILFIGNSFSDDTIQYMTDICEALDIEANIVNLFIGGCTLQTHYSNLISYNNAYEKRVYENSRWTTVYRSSINDEILYNNWDYISLQQASGYSGVSSSYSILPGLMNEIKDYLEEPDYTKFVWNMTWAYQQNSNHADFAKYNKSQDIMYSSIVDCVQEVISTLDFSLVIPNGTAIQNARTSYVGDNLTRDGYHLSYDFGRYIAGLMAVKTLTGADISNCSFAPKGIDESLKKVAFESVNNAFDFMYEVTPSEYTEAPGAPSLDSYDKLSLEFHQQAFYNSTVNSSLEATGSTLCKSFCATNIFSKNDLPNGSIISIKSGYKYRPDAWTNLSVKTTNRPDNVTLPYVTIDDEWWDIFSYVGFNISNTSGSILSSDEIDQILKGNVFAIYVPKK